MALSARSSSLFAALLLTFAEGTPVLAQSAVAVRAGPPAAHAARSSGPIVVDGRPDEAAWASAPLIAGFVQHEPQEGRPVSERTEVRILHDRDAIYIAAWLYDSDAAAIVPGEARRDVDLKESDAFVVVLDTYRDRQNAFVFGTSPAGVEYDGQITREGEGGFTGMARQQAGSGGGFNLNWDGRWTVRTTVDRNGWYAEFRIPFSTLRYARGGPQTWGLNLARYVRRRNEGAFWAPVPRQHTLYRVSLAGTLEGLDAPTRRVRSLTPYALGSVHRDFAAGARADNTAEAGADLKVGITPALVLDLTYNTDFAQVEVDEQQINLTRFNLFFPEKRPFFLENAGTFSVGNAQAVEMFFSRRIGIGPGGRPVPIRGGGRLSGRVAGLTVGLLDIQTASLDSSVAPTNYAVARVLRELPSRSRIGAFAAARVNTNDTDDRGLTWALDGRLGLGAALSFDGYAALTDVPGDAGRTHAWSASGTYNTRDWLVGATLREVGDGFDPQAGFLERRAYRLRSARIQRNLRPSNIPWFRELRPHVSYREHADLSGFTETRVIHLDSHFEFANGAFFQLPAINLTREGLRNPFTIAPGVVVPPGTYDNVEWGFAYNTNLSAPVAFQGRIDIGGFYSGRRAGATGTATVRRGTSFAAGLRYSYYDVRLVEGDFTTALVGLRLSYAFTPRVYVQSLTQYNRRTGEASGNLRLGWLNAAGTGLFVVLNAVEDVARPTGPLNRSVILKFTRQIALGG